MSVGDRERLARVALNQLCEPGDPKLAHLVDDIGAVRVHEALIDERQPDGMLTDVAARLGAVEPERVLENSVKIGLRFVIPGDPEWPGSLEDLARAESLRQRGGAPIGLWIKGRLRLDEITSTLAVVGSRSSTSYGEDAAGRISCELARAGCTVVSGAAFGIDAAAHRGALAGGGPTVAVLACGADKVYPSAHKNLLDHIAGQGAIVSESAPGSAPMRHRFLSRNRIIAALAQGTLVVEAGARSGALNTANWAGRLSRPVMALPGPVTSEASEGTHDLVRSGAAVLITGPGHVRELLAPAGEFLLEPIRGSTRHRDRLTERQQRVLDAVPVSSAASTGSIARTAGLGLDEVEQCLRALRHGDFVEQAADGWRLGAIGLE